jgi:hypothetical protein
MSRRKHKAPAPVDLADAPLDIADVIAAIDEPLTEDMLIQSLRARSFAGKPLSRTMRQLIDSALEDQHYPPSKRELSRRKKRVQAYAMSQVIERLGRGKGGFNTDVKPLVAKMFNQHSVEAMEQFIKEWGLRPKKRRR